MHRVHERFVLVAIALVAWTGTLASSSSTWRSDDRKPEVLTDAEQLQLLRSELGSADLALRAWGAWGASLTQKLELAPDVLAALKRTLTEPQIDPHEFVLRALLDAAIRLDIRLSSEDLADIESRQFFTSQVLVLASRDPAIHVDLLEHVRRKSTDEVRIASDNLLAACAPARATALLLPEVAVKIVIRVYDDQSQLPVDSMTTGVGCGTMKVPRGFPSTVLYRLVSGTQKGAQMIADGPEPIAVVRTPHKSLRIRFSSARSRFNESAHALGLLRWITGDRAEDSPLTAEIRIDHPWTSGSNYVTKVGEDIQLRRAAWRTLLGALVARELLAVERVPTSDPITILVEDLRKDQSVPLPDLPH